MDISTEFLGSVRLAYVSTLAFSITQTVFNNTVTGYEDPTGRSKKAGKYGVLTSNRRVVKAVKSVCYYKIITCLKCFKVF